MTLHEAMVNLFHQVGKPMTTKEIAEKLNENKWYQKKDRSMITSYQIYRRAKNYPAFFQCKGSVVSLKEAGMVKGRISDKPSKQHVSISQISTGDLALLEKVLMDEQNFKIAKDIDDLVPYSPGLYCIRIKSRNQLPKIFADILLERGHNILYVGIASKNLYKRFLLQELRAKGHGTFFRSLGAVLGYRPPKMSLIGKKNKRNYKFSKDDESKIIGWINRNLVVNWVKYTGNLNNIESDLIIKYLPLFNLSKNPAVSRFLQELRNECVEIANGY